LLGAGRVTQVGQGGGEGAQGGCVLGVQQQRALQVLGGFFRLA
jgi:hypothetical protein